MPSNRKSLLLNSQIYTLDFDWRNLKITARGLLFLAWFFFAIFIRVFYYKAYLSKIWNKASGMSFIEIKKINKFCYSWIVKAWVIDYFIQKFKRILKSNVSTDVIKLCLNTKQQIFINSKLRLLFVFFIRHPSIIELIRFKWKNIKDVFLRLRIGFVCF